jgi:hypothetical protein
MMTGRVGGKEERPGSNGTEQTGREEWRGLRNLRIWKNIFDLKEDFIMD